MRFINTMIIRRERLGKIKTSDVSGSLVAGLESAAWLTKTPETQPKSLLNSYDPAYTKVSYTPSDPLFELAKSSKCLRKMRLL